MLLQQQHASGISCSIQANNPCHVWLTSQTRMWSLKIKILMDSYGHNCQFGLLIILFVWHAAVRWKVKFLTTRMGHAVPKPEVKTPAHYSESNEKVLPGECR